MAESTGFENRREFPHVDSTSTTPFSPVNWFVPFVGKASRSFCLLTLNLCNGIATSKYLSLPKLFGFWQKSPIYGVAW